MTSSVSNLIHQLDGEKTKEPALKVGSITASVAGLVSVLLYFFPDIPETVLKNLFVIAVVAYPLITAIFIRGKVWSLPSVVQVVDESVERTKQAIKDAEKLDLHKQARETALTKLQEDKLRIRPLPTKVAEVVSEKDQPLPPKEDPKFKIDPSY